MNLPPWLGDARATAQRREDLWRLLGPRPLRTQGVGGDRLGDDDHAAIEHAAIEHARIERWRLRLNDRQDVPALLLRPGERPGETLQPRGVVLYCHAHGNRFDVGKDELLIGRPALQSPPYATALAARGWAALAIDHAGFGERRESSEAALVKAALWQGQTLWGWRLHDTLAVLDGIDACALKRST